MKPIDYAQRVVQVDPIGHQLFVVSIVGKSFRLPVELTPSAKRAKVLSLIGTHIIAHEVAAALRDEGCRLAAEIDQAYLANRIWLPTQAAALCRELAQLHTVELHTSETDR